MDKIISAQISVLPIQSNDYKADVNRAIEIIQKYELEYEIGIMSTTLRGAQSVLFELFNELFKELDKTCMFTIDLKLSNICGCEWENQ